MPSLGQVPYTCLRRVRQHSCTISRLRVVARLLDLSEEHMTNKKIGRHYVLIKDRVDSSECHFLHEKNLAQRWLIDFYIVLIFQTAVLSSRIDSERFYDVNEKIFCHGVKQKPDVYSRYPVRMCRLENAPIIADLMSTTKFDDFVYLNDEEDSGDRLELRSHKDKPKTIDDEEEEKRKEERRE
ncbi:hypothetical protein Tco_0294672 [Tanacetum coccineum]